MRHNTAHPGRKTRQLGRGFPSRCKKTMAAGQNSAPPSLKAFLFLPGFCCCWLPRKDGIQQESNEAKRGTEQKVFGKEAAHPQLSIKF